jgi:hypothetical protein
MAVNWLNEALGSGLRTVFQELPEGVSTSVCGVELAL